MRKICVFVTLIMMLLVGCGTPYSDNSNYSKPLDDGYFVEINHFDSYEDRHMRYKIVYAKDTRVKYLFAIDGYRYAITPLYNADGTLQIYEE